jgi:hypothetical protein
MMGRRVRQLYTRDNIQLTQTRVLSTGALAGGGGGGGGMVGVRKGHAFT